MKKIKSKKSFEKLSPIGMAGINKAFRLDFLTFEPIKENLFDKFTGLIQNFYQLILKNPMVQHFL